MTDVRYIAKTDIFAAPHVRAFRQGQEVPATAVENLQCHEQVETIGGKSPRKAAPEVGKDS